MKSTRNESLIQETLQKLNPQAGWTIERIKAWIGNRNAKNKEKTTDTPQKKYQAKGPSSFNMFCRGKACDSSDANGSFKSWADEWSGLDPSSKTKYSEAARKERENPGDHYDLESVLQKQLQTLLSTCNILEKIGCHVGGIIVKSDGLPTVFGTTSGKRYFSDLRKISDFSQNMLGDGTSNTAKSPSQLERKDLIKRVRQIFNAAWAAANNTTKQVPYGKIEAGQITVSVLGLPDGVSFSDPSSMGLEKLKKIISSESVKIDILRVEPTEKMLLDDQSGPDEITNEIEIEMPPNGASITHEITNEIENEMPPNGASITQNITDKVNEEVVHSEKSSNYAYQFKRLLERKIRKGKTQYLVEWECDGPPTWEPAKNIPLLFRKKFSSSLTG